MGMFDEIDFKFDCPICKNELHDFQSKDGRCLMNMLQPSDVTTFYDSCRE